MLTVFVRYIFLLIVHQSFLPAMFAATALLDEASLRANASSSGKTILYHYHPVMVDDNGGILPWFSPNPGQALDDALVRTWRWFAAREIETAPRLVGVRHPMFHQVWTPAHDTRGIGGDQVAQFLSSLDLLYDYTGDPAVIAEMRYQADFYLARSLSPTDCAWPSLPFPYNTDDAHGPASAEAPPACYDGDMILGPGYTQPDKAGSFAYELFKLHLKTREPRYLEAAIRIADTLAARVQPGDADHSPLPFKVHAITGQVGSTYTTNYSSTIKLFRLLAASGHGDARAYDHARTLLSDWLRNYPAKNQKWGPFFEDVVGWSDTQINAITYASHLLDHPDFDPEWRTTVPSIFNWVHTRLGNSEFATFQVQVINEQTSYPVPGQSHSARQAAAELLHASLTGDMTRVSNALRMLAWATYSIDFDGANRYPRDAIWYSDGYGDFWRHLLRAMAAAPQLAPDDANHLLESSAIVTHINYTPARIDYTTHAPAKLTVFRLITQPSALLADGQSLTEVNSPDSQGWTWQALPIGGVLRLHHVPACSISLLLPSSPNLVKFTEVNLRVLEGDTATRSIALTLHRGLGSVGPASVRVTTHDGTATSADSDYVPLDITCFWADGDFSPRTVSITVQGDTARESNESLGVTLSPLLGSPEIIHPNTARIEIENDDTPVGNIAASACKGWVWRGTTPFATHNPTQLAAIADGDFVTDFTFNNGSYQPAASYEMAGVIWNTPQVGITRALWTHGAARFEPDRRATNGPFSAAFGLQISRDGTTWQEVPDWNVTPAFPYNQGEVAAGQTFTFIGPILDGIRGLRIVGQVHLAPTDSWFATGRELQVFTDSTWLIQATAGANGKITPSGATPIPAGNCPTYLITPDPGYRIANVLIDGVSMGPISTYTFPEVVSAHAIVASFTPVTTP